MDSTKTISISEARKRIFDIAKKVQTPSSYFTLTENGVPKAVILSAEEFESWQETMEVIRDFPDIKKDADHLNNDIRQGIHRNYKTLDELLKEIGYTKIGHSPYDIRRATLSKSRARTQKTSR